MAADPVYMASPYCEGDHQKAKELVFGNFHFVEDKKEKKVICHANYLLILLMFAKTIMCKTRKIHPST